MELESTQSSTTAKLPLLKQDTTKEELVTQKKEMELESTQSSTTAKLPLLKQENSNSFKPVAETTTDDAGTLTTFIPGPVTIEEKNKKKNDVKTRSMLLMALSNKHMMTFNQYKDAKTLFAAIETRFDGNEATKKTQKSLLKQLYKNFTGTDLPSEWNTHVVVWRNKSDLDTMSLDDLYNNFKIVEQKVRGTTSTNTSSQNMAFVSSPSPNSTNEVHTVFGVSTASPQQLALLSMRAKRFFQKTDKKITINRSDIAGYDKSKVECFNCHKMGNFARECRVPRNPENRTRNQETTRRTMNVEDTSSKAVAIDGAGFDWSYMADDEAPINMDIKIKDSEIVVLKSKLEKISNEKDAPETKIKNFENVSQSLDKLIGCQVTDNNSEIVVLKSKLEKISNEKDALETKIENFENVSQSLDKLIGCQVTDNSKKGLEYVSYNVVQPPHTGSYGAKPIEVVTQKSSVKISTPVKENNGAPLIEDWESDEEDKIESPPEKERKTVEPSVDKVEVEIPKQNDKPTRRTVKYAKMYKTQRPRGNQRNWNNLKSHQLEGKDGKWD
nr:hypothetical protein [Tanacetum cinerariifolium]